MAPYARWVHSSFKQTLIDACDEFLESNDCGKDKKHTEVMKQVSKDITDIVQEKQEQLLDDLEKVKKNFPLCSKSSLMFPVHPHLVWELCNGTCDNQA